MRSPWPSYNFASSARLAQAVAIVTVLLVALPLYLRLRAETLASGGMPLWDMAAHAVDGIRLAEHARLGRLTAFLLEINRMSLWPPVFPLLSFPVFLLFGYDYLVAHSWMNVLSLLSLLACFLAGVSLGGIRGAVAGTVAASLMAASPIAQVYGTIVMLEVPGSLLLLLAMATYLRHTRRPDGRWAGAVAALTLVLFFCKYNYGILWMIALGTAELSRHSPWRQRVIEGMHPSRLWSLRSRRWLLPLLGTMAFLAALALTGGWTWSLAGREISVRSLGNPVLFLLWSLTAAFLLRPRRHLKRFLEIVRGLPLLPRTLAITVFPIIWGWLLIPSHAKNFFYFIQNRSSPDHPSMSGILYYPHSFLRDHSPSSLAGGLVLGVALLCALPIKRWRPEDRVLPLGLLTGFLFATFHSYKDPRFLFTVAPFVWLCAGAIGGALIEGIARGRRHSWAAAGAAIMAMALMGIAALNKAFDADDFRHRRAELSAPAPVRQVVESIAARAAGSRGTLLAGTWNGLSPGLVEWQCRISHQKARAGAPDPAIPLRSNEISPRLDAASLLDMASAQSRVTEILVLELDEGGRAWNDAYREENTWLPVLRNLLDADRRFELREVRSFPETGYTLRVYAKAPGLAATGPHAILSARGSPE